MPAAMQGRDERTIFSDDAMIAKYMGDRHSVKQGEVPCLTPPLPRVGDGDGDGAGDGAGTGAVN